MFGWSVGAIGALTIVVSAVVAYKKRFWFYLKYDLHPFDNDECVNEDKRFDVFLSFSSEDEELVKDLKDELNDQGYRICDHVRDFIIGQMIFDNMGYAILYSKRTICYVTRNFIESNFCKFEFDMAVNMDMQTNKKRLIVIMAEDIPKEELPESVRTYVKNFTYLTKDCPFFMKRLTYRLAQNKLGAADEIRPLLMEENFTVNYGTGRGRGQNEI